MSLIARHRREPEERLSTEGYLRMITSSSGRGAAVTAESSMRHDAVWSCRTRIAQDVSMMPVDVIRYVVGARQEVIPTPQIIAQPSVTTADAMDWRYQVIDSWLGWGNAWGIVTSRSTNGMYPTRIELQSPASVRAQDTSEGVKFFVNNVEHDLFPLGDLWHVPAYTAPGQLLGLSPISFHRLAISTGLEAQQFGNGFFQDGGHPNAIVGIDGDPGEDQAKSLKEKLIGITRGNRELIVLPKSTTYTPLSVNPSDSQFIETMRYSVEQVCRIFGEDPADHGSSGGGSSLTYANRSDADLARFKRRQFWVTKLQNSLTALVPDPLVVKLNTSSSLMMTTKERHEIHKLRLDSRTTTINAVKAVEDESPFSDPAFDVPGIPAVGGSDAAEIERQAVILQKMYLSVGVVITADEAREMARKAGVDLSVTYDPTLLGAAPAPAPPGDDESDRSDEIIAEIRANAQPVTIHNHVDARSEPPVVNVTTPEVVVNMPDITVDARSEPPVVNVTVERPEVEQRATRKTIEHTADGRIAAIIEEPV